MPSCVVKSCKNYLSKHKKSQGITYHTFPRNKNRDDWISIIRSCRGESNWNPSPGSTVCSAHFEEKDFMTTAKGLRCLVPYAFPKRLLSNSPETQTHGTFSPVVQVSTNARKIANDQQPTSSLSTMSSLPQKPVIKEEFPLSGYCRLCASLICDGTLVNVESDNVLKELVVNMSNRLNTNIDFSQEHLPTTVCPVCIKSLYMSYDFVVGIDLAQKTLNEISMQKHNHQIPVLKLEVTNVDLSNTSLQQTNNRTETACDLDQPGLHVSSETTSSQQLSSSIEEASHLVELKRRRKCQLEDTLYKKRLIIDQQKNKIKILNQKVRRFRSRNESLKKILKNLKEQISISPDLCNILTGNIGATELLNNLNRKKKN